MEMPSWQGRCAVRDAGVHVVVRACKNDVDVRGCVSVVCVEYCAAMGLGGHKTVALGDSSTYVCASSGTQIRMIPVYIAGCVNENMSHDSLECRVSTAGRGARRRTVRSSARSHPLRHLLLRAVRGGVSVINR